MKKFIVIYHAPAEAMAAMGEASPAEKEQGMKLWYDWKERIGDGLVELGAPLMGGQRLLQDGTAEMSTKEVSGYSILQAKDIDGAKKLLSGHPHLQWSGGCDIEVYETVAM